MFEIDVDGRVSRSYFARALIVGTCLDQGDEDRGAREAVGSRPARHARARTRARARKGREGTQREHTKTAPGRATRATKELQRLSEGRGKKG
jgi:hypothetical protein